MSEASLRVLIVDDNVDMVESLTMVLRLLHHAVESASCGADALRTLAAWQPDLALIDVSMPGMSGYEVAQQARALVGGQVVHLVAMTGWSGAEHHARALRAGFDRHVVKPLDLDELRKVLAELTARRGTPAGHDIPTLPHPNRIESAR